MKRYEYETEAVALKTADFMTRLHTVTNQRGRDGWRMVAQVFIGEPITEGTLIVTFEKFRGED